MSAPPIRIESKAWTDHRYAALALRLGLASPRFALVLVADLWCWQTEHYTDERPTYSVPRSVIEGALGNLHGPEFLVAADLAELEPDGRYRIRGGRDDKGNSRIDWLWREREQRKSAGRASADRRKASGDPRGKHGTFGELTTSQPTSHQRATNEPPTGDQRQPNGAPSSLVSGLRSPEISDSLSRSVGAREGEPATPGEIGLLVDHAVDALNAARLELDPDSRPIGPMDDPPGREQLRQRLRATGADQRKADLTLALTVLTAEAKRDGDVGLLRLGMLGGAAAWSRLLAGSATTRATRGRDGPGGAPLPAKPLRGAAAAFANLDPEDP